MMGWAVGEACEARLSLWEAGLAGVGEAVRAESGAGTWDGRRDGVIAEDGVGLASRKGLIHTLGLTGLWPREWKGHRGTPAKGPATAECQLL